MISLPTYGLHSPLIFSVILDTVEISEVQVKNILFDPGQVNLVLDQILPDSAVGNISLEKDTDCLSVPEDYTLIVSGILSGNDYIAFLGKDHTYAHRNQAKEINGILYGIAVCIFHMGAAHIQSRSLSLFLSVWPDTGKSGNVSCCIYTFRSCLEIIGLRQPQ